MQSRLKPLVEDRRCTPSFICHQYEPQKLCFMGTATNFVIFDKSFQAASLGDASLIAIVTTIQVLLHAVEELLQRN